jgi:hypothetical protein
LRRDPAQRLGTAQLRVVALIGAAALVVVAGPRLAFADHGPRSTTDTEGWYELGVDFDLPKRFEASVSGELRWQDDHQRFRRGLLEGSVGYEPLKIAGHRPLQLSLLYRFTAHATELDDAIREDVRDLSHRVSGGVRLRHDFGAVDVQLRSRLQSEATVGAPADTEGYLRRPFELLLREKLQARLEVWKAVRPFVYTEWFRGLQGAPTLWWRFRVGGGVAFKWARDHALSVRYIAQQERAVPGADRKHIVSMAYTFEVD